MPLLIPRLAAGLSGLIPTDQESQGLDNLTRAWLDYFEGASVLGVPALRPALEGLPRQMFERALANPSQANTLPAKLQAAILAFWLACGPLATTIWVIPPPTIIVPGTLIPPLGNVGLAALLTADFLSNTNGRLERPAAAGVVARTIGLLQLGATIQTQVPPAVPVTTPIL